MAMAEPSLLEPLLLEDEFDAEEQEPKWNEQTAADADSSAALFASPLDFLQLKADPQLSRFFEAIESESQNSCVRELLLLSCAGHRRTVDAALLGESRRPVVQGRERSAAEKETAAAAADAQRGRKGPDEQRDAAAAASAVAPAATQAQAQPASSARRPSTSANGANGAAAPDALASPSKASALWRRLTKDKSDTSAPADRVDSANSAQVTGADSVASPKTSARISEWIRNKIKDKDDTAEAGASAQPASAGAGRPSVMQPLQRQAPPARRHSQSLLPDDTPAPMSYAVTSRSSGGRSATTTSKSPSPSPSHSSLAATAAAAAAEAERRARAPTASPPEACTLLLSNLALYIFPPSIPVEIETEHAGAGQKQVKHFMVYNEYERVPLQDVSLVSLPYRSGLTRHGTDFALRINDFALHLRDGSVSLWMQAPRNCRSLLVEAISDAYDNLVGCPLPLLQPDYSELIGDILSAERVQALVSEVRAATWRGRSICMSGYLHHRSIHVWPSLVEDNAAPAAPAAPASASAATAAPAPRSHRVVMRMGTPSEWRLEYFALTSDGFLLRLHSQQELEALKYVAAAFAQGRGAGRFPNTLSSEMAQQVDLSKSVHLRASPVCAEGFEIIVYPRSSSMHAPSASSSSSSSSADAAGAGAGGAGAGLGALSHSRTSSLHVVANQATLEYGYTRHLFQVPLPPALSAPSAAAAAAGAAGGGAGMAHSGALSTANQRRMQQHMHAPGLAVAAGIAAASASAQPGSAPGTPVSVRARRTASIDMGNGGLALGVVGMSPNSSGAAAAAAAAGGGASASLSLQRDPAITVAMAAEMKRWMRALRATMKEPAPLPQMEPAAAEEHEPPAQLQQQQPQQSQKPQPDLSPALEEEHCATAADSASKESRPPSPLAAGASPPPAQGTWVSSPPPLSSGDEDEAQPELPRDVDSPSPDDRGVLALDSPGPDLESHTIRPPAFEPVASPHPLPSPSSSSNSDDIRLSADLELP